MVIDFSVRPPYKSFLRFMLYHRPPPPSNPREARALTLKREKVPSQESKSLELFMQEMDEAGISLAVLQGLQVNRSVAYIENDDIAHLEKQFPQRFLGLGGLDVSEPEQALQELERCIVKLNLKGICISPPWGETPRYPDDRALDPIYERCQEMNVLVSMLLSIYTGPDLNYCNPLSVQRVALRFPDLKIVVCHACWPYIDSMIGVAMQCRNVYLAPDFYSYIPNMPMANQLVRAANSVLQYRMLFASSYPSWHLPQSVREFRSLPLSTEVMEDCLFGNASYLLKGLGVDLPF